LGKIDFANLFFVLKEGAKAGPYDSLTAATEAGAVTLNLGNFMNTIISFIIVAFAVFMLIKAMNSLQAKLDAQEKKIEKKTAPTTKDCPFCCSVIPVNATKCPNCTSDLKPAQKKK
jgi:large conductance mechanosensitive channel